MAGKKRIDSASKMISASPQLVYDALLDPEALVEWLPPKGMKGRIHAFEPREGGTYRIALTYEAPNHSTDGKTTQDSDVVEGRFRELIPNERIVQVVEFQSKDPSFAGSMSITWSLAAMPGGTEVTVICENVPHGIRKEDHDAGLRSTLENLAAFAERRR